MILKSTVSFFFSSTSILYVLKNSMMSFSRIEFANKGKLIVEGKYREKFNPIIE